MLIKIKLYVTIVCKGYKLWVIKVRYVPKCFIKNVKLWTKQLEKIKLCQTLNYYAKWIWWLSEFSIFHSDFFIILKICCTIFWNTFVDYFESGTQRSPIQMFSKRRSKYTVCCRVIQPKPKFPRGLLIFLCWYMLGCSEFIKKTICHQSLEGAMAKKMFQKKSCLNPCSKYVIRLNFFTLLA